MEKVLVRNGTYDYIRNILIPSRPDLDFYEAFPELRGHINVWYIMDRMFS